VLDPAVAQLSADAEPVDTAAISRIIDEGINRSQVMDIFSWLTDVYGPRLTGSTQYRQAAEWVRAKFESWNMADPHFEGWGPFGRGWSLVRFSAHVISPTIFPLLSYPKAWSPGTDGTVVGEAVYLDAKNDSTLETFHGKLGKKFVLLSEPQAVKAHFEPQAARETDSHLLELSNADPSKTITRNVTISTTFKERGLLAYKRNQLCQKEGALAILTASRGDGGNIFVQSATISAHPDTPNTNRTKVYDATPPKILPQVAVAAEHYNRLLRLLEKGQRVRIEMNLDVEFSKADSGYNVIAEIPGSDLSDQVVMIGAHLDSWHGGTGATDNGTGVATCMEAMRILSTLGLKPRRTIRIALWGGEEQGEFGSKAYVQRHFGSKTQSSADSIPVITLKPAAEKFSVYFNIDNGTGKIRGVYMQGNEAVRSIFRAWLTPFEDLGASTLTVGGTSGTDHMQFDTIGLPAFQFIQDQIEYFTRSWHSTMDLYDRAQEEDLKVNSVIMAAIAYAAAMRDEKLPRKPMIGVRVNMETR